MQSGKAVLHYTWRAAQRICSKQKDFLMNFYIYITLYLNSDSNCQAYVLAVMKTFIKKGDFVILYLLTHNDPY